MANRLLARQRRSEAGAFEASLAALTIAINQTCDDALAHARNVLTETLDLTTEGRPTAAKVRKSRSYQAALARLAELVPRLTEWIEAFRVANYRAAFAFWASTMPEQIRRGDSEGPSDANVDRCRTAMIHGRTLRQDLAWSIDQVVKRLAPVLTVAGNRALPAREANLLLDRWAAGTRGTIQKRVRALLVDSQTMADRLAGRDAIRPEFLDPDPSLPG